MFNTRRAYDLLMCQYPKVVKLPDIKRYMPIKTCEVLHEIEGVPTITELAMEGTTLTGMSIRKKIRVDDEKGKTHETVILYDHYGETIDKHVNDNFTPFRCGVVVCAAIAEMCKVTGVKVKSVGIIGNGNVNMHVARAIHEMFAIERWVVHGSKKHRGKNREKFFDAEVDSDGTILNQCDVIVSCTSDCSGTDMLGIDQLPDPRIFIALDCGYELDESIRQRCKCYSDYTEQIEAHYDEEFIFDKKKYPMAQLFLDRETTDGKVFVCLYGIGFADAVVAESIYENGRTTEA